MLVEIDGVRTSITNYHLESYLLYFYTSNLLEFAREIVSMEIIPIQ